MAEPGTITGSIGVLTGKVSVGKSLDLVGVSCDEVAVGKNTLMDSPLTPYTPEQWAALNHEADVIYDDFLHKVAAGRKLPLDQVQDDGQGPGLDRRRRQEPRAWSTGWAASGRRPDWRPSWAGFRQDQVAFRIYPRRAGPAGGA